MSRGEMSFIEQMFEVSERLQGQIISVLQVNAGNGDGCNELISWIKMVASDGFKQDKDIKGP